MDKEADKNTRRFSRRVFVLIGVLLLLLAAAGFAIAYSRASVRKSIEEGQINPQALIAPPPELKPAPTPSPIAAASPTPTPIVIPKPVTVCFKDRLDLRASANEVFQGAAVTFSTPGVQGGGNYSAVNYQWKSSAGKLISNGLKARLDTSEFTAPTSVTVSIEAVSNDGVCRASSGNKVIRIHPPYRPPVISLETGESRSSGVICAGERVNLRINTAESDLRYEWQSTGGRIAGGGNNAVFDTSGLAPGLYTVSVMAEGSKGAAFDSIALVVSDCSPQARRDAECFSPELSVDYRYAAGGIMLIAQLKGYSPQLGKVTFDWKAAKGKVFGGGAIAWFDSRSVLSETAEITVSARSEKGDCKTNVAGVAMPRAGRMAAMVARASLSEPGPCDGFRRNDATLPAKCQAELRSLAAKLNIKRSSKLYVDIERAKGEAEGVDLMRGKSIHDYLVYVLGVNANQVIVRPGGASGADQTTGLEMIEAGETPPSGPPAVIFAPEAASAPPPPPPPPGPPIGGITGGGIKAGAAQPSLKFQEEVKGDYPSRVETEAKDSISLRFVRKLVQNPTTTSTSTTEGDRTKTTETVNQVPGRSLETPLEQAMGEGYEPWIKATLSSPTFETTPKNAETADWRRLDASPEIAWEWTITTNSTTPLQELKAEVDVEWRPTGATKGDVIKHRLWEGALQIDVDNPVLKVQQVKTATPIFSVAGLASIVVGVYPRRRRKEGEGEEGEEELGFEMMAPPSPPSEAAPSKATPGGEKSGEPPTIVPVRAGKDDDETNEANDLVECSVFSPPTAPRGATIMVQVFAHLEGRSADAEKMALEFDETARRRAVKTLSARVARETELMFHLTISNWKINEPVQTLVWMGDAESVQFVVDVPPDCKLGAAAGKVTVSQNSVPIGQISFILKVAEQAESAEQTPVPTGDDAWRYKYAFISYASADRDKVLARVQMLEQFGIEYFQDILDLDPGDRWEKELYKNIDQCDLFLLFWSQHAKASPWVMKEVEYALARKGADENAPPEIKPVIIEGPPIVPPPEKLAKLHFNDRLIYFFSKK